MRAPHWLAIMDMRPDADGRAMVVSVRVRRWHPGFWLACLRLVPTFMRIRRAARAMSRGGRR